MFRMTWRLVVYLLVLYSLLWIVLCYKNGYLHISHLSMSFALYLRHDCDKRMYYFEGRIARRDGYYISRDVSRAAKVTIIEVHVVRRDRFIDRYVPHRSQTERQRVCIVIKDMHHYIWHCILWHWTLIIDELEDVFCWSCECFFVKLVNVEYCVVIENV